MRGCYEDVQALALLMHLASSTSTSQQPAAVNSSDGASGTNARRLLTKTLMSVLQLGEEGSSRVAPASDIPGNQNMDTGTATQAAMHACKDAEGIDVAMGAAAQRAHGRDVGVHAICFALLECITAEFSSATGSSCNGMVEPPEHEVLPPPSSNLAGTQLGMCEAFDLHHAPDDQPCNPGSSASDPDMSMHAWNVVQCLLLDFLCCLVQLQGSQGLGAIVSRVKKFCQQHVPYTNTAGTSSGGDGGGCGHASHTVLTELWTYRVSWVLNVRFFPV